MWTITDKGSWDSIVLEDKSADFMHHFDEDQATHDALSSRTESFSGQQKHYNRLSVKDTFIDLDSGNKSILTSNKLSTWFRL